MNGDPVERLRLHLERHKHRQQAFFSIAGLRELLEQHDAMRAQIERLLRARSADISEALIRK